MSFIVKASCSLRVLKSAPSLTSVCHRPSRKAHTRYWASEQSAMSEYRQTRRSALLTLSCKTPESVLRRGCQ